MIDSAVQATCNFIMLPGPMVNSHVNKACASAVPVITRIHHAALVFIEAIPIVGHAIAWVDATYYKRSAYDVFAVEWSDAPQFQSPLINRLLPTRDFDGYSGVDIRDDSQAREIFAAMTAPLMNAATLDGARILLARAHSDDQGRPVVGGIFSDGLVIAFAITQDGYALKEATWINHLSPQEALQFFDERPWLKEAIEQHRNARTIQIFSPWLREQLHPFLAEEVFSYLSS